MTSNIYSNVNRAEREPRKHIHTNICVTTIFFFSTQTIQNLFTNRTTFVITRCKFWGPCIRRHVQCFTTDIVMTSQPPFTSIRVHFQTRIDTLERYPVTIFSLLPKRQCLPEDFSIEVRDSLCTDFWLLSFLFFQGGGVRMLYSKKGKAIPITGLCGPEDSGRLRLPDFQTLGT